MQKLFALCALGALLIFGLSACKPGVYYPFGGGPQSNQYYVPVKGQPAPQQPAPKPGSEKTSWVIAG